MGRTTRYERILIRAIPEYYKYTSVSLDGERISFSPGPYPPRISLCPKEKRAYAGLMSVWEYRAGAFYFNYAVLLLAKEKK